MRLLHALQPNEMLICQGQYRYMIGGKPAGQIETWQVTLLPDERTIIRADVAGQSRSGVSSLLTHLQRLPDGRPEWLRMRWSTPQGKSAAQYTFEDASIKITRQREDGLRKQEIVEIADGYEVDYHSVIAHEYVWRGYPKRGEGKAWAIPVFSPNLWKIDDEILEGRSLRFSIRPLGLEDLSTTLGDFEQARSYEITLDDGTRALAWYDEFGVPLRWLYPDKKYDFVLVAYARQP